MMESAQLMLETAGKNLESARENLDNSNDEVRAVEALMKEAEGRWEKSRSAMMNRQSGAKFQ
jgi:hypothetical protein